MLATVVRIHEETKKGLDEYISKETRTYDDIIRQLLKFKKENLHNNKNKEKVECASFADTHTLSKPVDNTGQELT